MNKFFEFLNRIKSKWVQPKIYAITCKSERGTFLLLESGYSLEEAYGKGIASFKKENPDWKLEHRHMEMFTHKTLESILDGYIDTSVQSVGGAIGGDPAPLLSVSSAPSKDELMKKIVDSKNRSLLEENRSIFSEAEIKYLEDKLKTKK